MRDASAGDVIAIRPGKIVHSDDEDDDSIEVVLIK